ncbi:hypothetical protein D9M71_668560 [compost metagenome]
MSRCVACSMPSASTAIPMLWPRVTIERTMAMSALSWGRPRTKLWSSFSLCTGKCLRRVSDDWPVPKSSMDSCTPSLRRRVAMSCAAVGSCITLLSVISNSTLLGSTPVRSRIWAT